MGRGKDDRPRVAVLASAGPGLGAAIAGAFARAGHRVAGLSPAQPPSAWTHEVDVRPFGERF
jgi:NAD(P)-dependent dehydrogenase (short-subunit alcohol dehydrogenase family)